MTVNTDDRRPNKPEPSASVSETYLNHIYVDDDQLADCILGSKTFARDWATMFNALNDMSMQTCGVSSGSCPDMGRLSSADSSSSPKKVTHPTHTPPIGADCDRGHSDSYDICR